MSGIAHGVMPIFVAGRQVGKSTLHSMMMNSHGIYSNVTQLTVTKAYKGEWKVEFPWREFNKPEFEAWCTEILGNPGRNPKYRWRASQLKYGIYFFRDEHDVLMLTLRWM